MAGTVTPTAATEAQFNDWLALYEYTVPAADKTKLLNLSFAFMSMLDFCTAGDTVPGQCFIAYNIANGGFDPVSPVDGKSLIEKGLGRNAIVKKWSINPALSGTEAVSMLRRLPMAFGALEDMLCSASLVSTTTGITNFEVFR